MRCEKYFEEVPTYFTSNIATQSTLVCEQLCIEDERDMDQIYFLGDETSNGDESHRTEMKKGVNSCTRTVI